MRPISAAQNLAAFGLARSRSQDYMQHACTRGSARIRISSSSLLPLSLSLSLSSLSLCLSLLPATPRRGNRNRQRGRNLIRGHAPCLWGDHRCGVATTLPLADVIDQGPLLGSRETAKIYPRMADTRPPHLFSPFARKSSRTA